MAVRAGLVSDAWAFADPRGALDPSAHPGPVPHRGSGAPDLDPVAAPGSPEAHAIGGLSRRRVAFLVGTFVTIWIVAVFARQIGDASNATQTADRLRAENAALQAEISGLSDELARISETPYVAQQARGFGVGSGRERAFVIDPDAPPLAADAPGSAAVRLGSDARSRSPLETWLSLLFGGGRS